MCVCAVHIPAPVCAGVCVFIVRLGKAAFTLAGGDIIGSVWRSGCSLRLKPSEGLWIEGGAVGSDRGG